MTPDYLVEAVADIPTLKAVFVTTMPDCLLFGEDVADFVMPGNCRSFVQRRVKPPRMAASLSEQFTFISAQMLDQVCTLHSTIGSTS